MTHPVPPSATAWKVVTAWESATYGAADVATPWNALVEAYGLEEARTLVHAHLLASGHDNPDYNLNCIERYARRQTGEE